MAKQTEEVSKVLTVAGHSLSDYAEWRRNRGTYIGGSDVAAILGISPYRNIGETWLEKVRAQEKLESDDATADSEIENRFTRWGKRHESVILDEYQDVTGFALDRPGLTLFRHPEFPFIGGTLDARAVTPHGDLRVVEAKTTDSFLQYRTQMWGADGSDEVPEHYLVQGMQYMIVTGLQLVDFAVLIGGSDFRIFHVPYDAELAELMVAAQQDFWKKVEKREPPPMDYRAKGAYELQRRIYNKMSGEVIAIAPDYRLDPSSPTVAELFIRHDDAVGAKERAEAEIEEAKAQLAAIAGNNALVQVAGTKLGIKRSPRKAYEVSYTVDESIVVELQPKMRKSRAEQLDKFRGGMLKP